MSEPVVLLHGEEGPLLMVRGTDPAVIHAAAAEWAAEDGTAVSDDVADVLVRSIRAIAWCPIEACGCGNPGKHYIPTTPGSRGSFRGAFVELHDVPEEVAAHGLPDSR